MIALLAFFLLAGCTIVYHKKIKRFIVKSAYFKMELDRAVYGERSFWKKKLLREYLLLLPIPEKWIKKLME